ncbi:MAG: hypothetical protein WCJ76_14980 [Comamonadaceae bacterium]
MSSLFTYQRELRKRLDIPYIWPSRQNDTDDQTTDFIYRCASFDQAHAEAVRRFGTGASRYYYALNRWYNFTSARAVEAIFARHPRVIAERDTYHKLVDFRLDGIPFDHKTTVWPKAWKGDLDACMQSPQPLLTWLYANQSRERRHHVCNRLFLVLYREDGAHWKLKADLGLLATRIEEYLDAFTPDDLTTITIGERTAQAGVIWATEY